MVSEQQNNRLRWQQVPEPLHAFAERMLGSSVVSAQSQPGGFSPGSADRIRGADGSRIFVKTVSSDLNAFSFQLFEQEAAVCVALRDVSLPAPAFLGHFVSGNWIALAFEDVDGHEPGSGDADVDAVLDALDHLPIAPAGLALPQGPFTIERTAQAELARWSEDWNRAVDNGVLDITSGYAVQHSEDISGLVAAAGTAVVGNHIVHLDLHSDNVVIDADERAWIVDWPWTVVGAGWLDAVSYLSSLLATLPVEVVDARLVARDRIFGQASAHDVDAALAALAASRLRLSLLPSPPGLVGLRESQRAYGLQTLDWLAYRRGW